MKGGSGDSPQESDVLRVDDGVLVAPMQQRGPHGVAHQQQPPNHHRHNNGHAAGYPEGIPVTAAVVDDRAYGGGHGARHAAPAASPGVPTSVFVCVSFVGMLCAVGIGFCAGYFVHKEAVAAEAAVSGGSSSNSNDGAACTAPGAPVPVPGPCPAGSSTLGSDTFSATQCATLMPYGAVNLQDASGKFLRAWRDTNGVDLRDGPVALDYEIFHLEAASAGYTRIRTAFVRYVAASGSSGLTQVSGTDAVGGSRSTDAEWSFVPTGARCLYRIASRANGRYVAASGSSGLTLVASADGAALFRIVPSTMGQQGRLVRGGLFHVRHYRGRYLRADETTGVMFLSGTDNALGALEAAPRNGTLFREATFFVPNHPGDGNGGDRLELQLWNRRRASFDGTSAFRGHMAIWFARGSVAMLHGSAPRAVGVSGSSLQWQAVENSVDASWSFIEARSGSEALDGRRLVMRSAAGSTACYMVTNPSNGDPTCQAVSKSAAAVVTVHVQPFSKAAIVFEASGWQLRADQLGYVNAGKGNIGGWQVWQMLPGSTDRGFFLRSVSFGKMLVVPSSLGSLMQQVDDANQGTEIFFEDA